MSLVDELVTEKITKFRDIPLCGRVARDNFDNLANAYCVDGAVKHHYRFRAVQP